MHLQEEVKEMLYTGLSSKKYSVLGLVIFVTTAIGGCGTRGVLWEVSEENKDPLFTYDGAYNIEVVHRGGRQEMGNGWSINCGPTDFTMRVSVKNSEVSWRFDGQSISSYVDRNGKFRLEAPLDWKNRNTSGVASIDSMEAVLQGVIHADYMEGRFVYARAQFNGRGCTYPVKISQVG